MVSPRKEILSNMPQPEIISPDNTERLASLKKEGVEFRDTLNLQIDELCEIENPPLRDKPEEMHLKKEEYRALYSDKGVFCYLPWRQVCLHILERDLLYILRTARNHHIIGKEEQKRFGKSVIAIAGLSVGSNVARIAALLGARRLRIVDKDYIGPSNLNRILCGVQDIGRLKVETIAELLFETDPYLDLFVSSSAINEGTIDQFLGDHDAAAGIIIDEVDDLDAKITLRKAAAKRRVPLLSAVDNGDSVLVDIERYDRDYDIDLFFKKLEASGDLSSAKTAREKAISITRFIGPEDLETSVLKSILDVSETLYSWPQLGSTAVLAATAIVYCIRHIIIKDVLESGRYVVSLSSSMRVQDPLLALRPNFMKILSAEEVTNTKDVNI